MSTDTTTSDDTYGLGRSSAETQRLITQARLYDRFTRQVLLEAGITTGMKVLDVGSGAGDVALLVADLVGPMGTVVGVDVNPIILETARARVKAAGLANITFLAGEVGSLELEHDFDAVVGRWILMHVPDPVETVRAVTNYLRTGGIIAFQESDFTTPMAALPPSRLLSQLDSWARQTMQRGGVEWQMGLTLYQVYQEAGLPAPEMRVDTLIGGGRDWPGYLYLADTARSVLPFAQELGVFTAEQLDVDTLADRLRDEVVSQRGVVILQPVIGAWTRKTNS